MTPETFALAIIAAIGTAATGIIVGVVAMVSDVFTIRRFFSVDHKWRWWFSGVALCVTTANHVGASSIGYPASTSVGRGTFW